MNFEYCFAYEDRACVHTSRWLLQDVDTRPTVGDTKSGRLWLRSVSGGGNASVELFKDPACGPGDSVATGVADISQIDQAPARCVLSGSATGEFRFERYACDPAGPVEVVVSLCTDEDLLLEATGAADLPVRDESTGLADYCAQATRNVLLLAAQIYADQLGGAGAPEGRSRADAWRDAPDFRRVANCDQLTTAAVHWALAAAFGACHERADETMYSRLRDYHDRKRREAVGAWNLAFIADPDVCADAAVRRASGAVRVTRL